MNKLRIPLKVAVILFFIGNTGIFNEMPKFASDERRNDPTANAAVMRLCEERYVAATAQVEAGGVYSPYDYFRDLNDIYRMEDSLKVNVGYYARHGVNDLQALSMRFLDEKRFTYDDVEKARESFKDGRIGALRDDAKNTSWATVWRETLSPWLIRQYFEGLPFACILLLIWIGEGSDRKKKFFVRSPASLVFSLLLYPLVFALVFAKWVRNAGRSVYAEVELRRTKDAFLAILSSDELEAIRKFAESRLTRSAWRRKLERRGLVARRSFALGFASFALCFVVLGPQQAFAHERGTLERHTIVIQGSSGGLECPADTDDGDQHNHYAFEHEGLTFETEGMFRTCMEHAQTVCEGWMRDVEHIPVSRLTGFRKSLTNLLTIFKETGNESILFDITHRSIRYDLIRTAAG